MPPSGRRVALALALLAAVPVVIAQSPWRGYDEAADADASIAHAVQRVQGQPRKVLVVFGANWCGDCRVLDETMKTGRLKQLVDAHFEVVKVDVGRFDRNVPIAERYAVPLKKGIPTIAIVDGSGRATFVTQAGELADARAMGEAGLVRFFDRTW
jgi:protein disulfide-isomerase